MHACNHTSVGLVVLGSEPGTLLLIERRRFPFGFACPAGHTELGESPEQAAARELREEVGLEVTKLTLLLEEIISNACRRPEGTFHHWWVYQAETRGSLQENTLETKQVGWYGALALHAFARRAEAYRTRKIGEQDWRRQPGLEPVWYDFLRTLGFLKMGRGG